MKYFYSLIFLLGVIIIGNAQIIDFPDANFKNYLLSATPGNNISTDNNFNGCAIDTNNDGQIQESEALAIYLLRVNGTGLNITNLAGLEHFTNLRDLQVYYTNVTNLNASQLVNLQYLSCNNNLINSINVDGLVNLKQLNCRDNNISSINFNQLTSIEDLLCDNNSLTSVNLNGLLHLKQLYVGFNNITSFSIQNSPQIFALWCHNNMIPSLEVNHLTELTTLYCQNNLLTTIDVSNLTNLLDFFFSGNHQLANINMKNGSYQNIDYSIGLDNINYVCADETEINQILTVFASNNYTYCTVNSYCSFVPGGTYYTIQGNSKLDSNSNGCNADDFTFPNLNLSITDGTNTGNFIPNSNGSYFIPVQVGTHIVTPVLENPTYFNISPSNFQVTFPTAASPFYQNFCISPNGSHQDLETWIVPLTPARPGFNSKYKIKYKNKGTVPVSGNIIFAFNDDYMDFVSASQIINNQSYSLLSWDYVNLLPYQTREIEVILNINSPMESLPVNIGDVIKFSSTINPSVGDEYISDNANRLAQTVVGSLDPNDKLCVEGNTVGPDIIGDYVHYVIRFENTGTFAAENIVVKDIIDTDKFDLATLVSLDGSHDFKTRITNSNVAEFIFENINLPFDDANNDGYVAFKIKTKPSLVVGDIFSNTASIYFDYNFPINTNLFTTTIQTLGNQDFDFNTNFNLFPNPTNNLLNIKSTTVLFVNSVSIYNMLGQLIQVDTHPTEIIDVSALKPGNYFISISTDKGKSTNRFVKN